MQWGARFCVPGSTSTLGRWRWCRWALGVEGGAANDYDYVHGDPVNMLDPDGRSMWDWAKKNARGIIKGAVVVASIAGNSAKPVGITAKIRGQLGKLTASGKEATRKEGNNVARNAAVKYALLAAFSHCDGKLMEKLGNGKSLSTHSSSVWALAPGIISFAGCFSARWPSSGAGMKAEDDPEYQRALACADEVFEQRGGTDAAERAAMPAWLATRYFEFYRVSWLLMLLAAVAVVVANDGRWYFHVLAAVLLFLAGCLRFAQWIMVGGRRRDAARIRRYGPDEYDTLEQRLRAVRAKPRMSVRVLDHGFNALLGALLLAEALVVWDEGVVARIGVVVALSAFAASLVYSRLFPPSWRWKADFLRDEGHVLPPLPACWEVMVDWKAGRVSQEVGRG